MLNSIQHLLSREQTLNQVQGDTAPNAYTTKTEHLRPKSPLDEDPTFPVYCQVH